MSLGNVIKEAFYSALYNISGTSFIKLYIK